MSKKDRLNSYLATILLPSLLVDEVKNVVSMEQEDIRKLNQSILKAKGKLINSMTKEYHKMTFDINTNIFKRKAFLDKIDNIRLAKPDFIEFVEFINDKNWNWKYLSYLNYL